MSKLISISAFLFLSHFSYSQAAKERILIRVYEHTNSEIIITTPSSSETIDLKGAFKSLRKDNDKIILSTLMKYFSLGYRIESSNSISNPDVITTYVLIKE